MSIQPLFFEPVFKERIWGGEQLKSFGYDIPSTQTGECWAFAAHSNGQSVVKNGEYKGLTLGEIWENKRELFGNIDGDRFPLLTKILDAAQDLSVQVHPDDEYGLKHEGDLGKTECWYIIDCEEGAEIIYGHTAKTREELAAMIHEGRWDELLTKVPVKPGDFFFVPSGTVHAIGAGIVILETQQNSDTTYRVYDYDRRDNEGNLRELHIEQSIAVTTVPAVKPEIQPVAKTSGDMKITTFLESDYFTVHKWELEGTAKLNQNLAFQLVSVIEGTGSLVQGNGKYEFKKGDHFLLPSGFGEYELEGNAELIVSHL
ncbi:MULTISPECIES: mannose-6-phosphate isomerase, class I [unclassified Mesobacillus]|jgi:mannose-6-phosphate isomerase|uniref:mannose-6-phosphate isomerase, class I n=1 Tax=unclassified Mesobacillus TaxID=2675270 RepID=UPI00203E349C|nr:MULTISPECIES: mannose-6-phosphate isomerase, class I [unclassified Mesobacillus]MCM3123886.1 mannose-6-phosphate isomerase, class I [Mesobacillus sp. MER 33]MCM3234099.1 mannose-6-phosphate isomerase, class I [Mesobacillus sp. MER 48]